MKGVILDANLQVWAIVWLLTALYILLRHWRGHGGIGFVLTYVASFASIHWLGAILYLLPWYYAPGRDLVAEGMRESALAMIGFALGGEFVLWWLHRSRAVEHDDDEGVGPDSGPADYRLPELEDAGHGLIVSGFATNIYLATGVFFYAVVSPIVGKMATLNALVGTGSTLIVVGLGLKCWNAWQRGQRQLVWAWLLASALLPFVTVATQGFLGYGLAGMVSVFAFVAAFYTPRWKVVVASVLVAYLGLSVYVTYMRDRADIRQLVWGGSTLQDRLGRVSDTVNHFEWFDIHDDSHLARIDDRLNQDYLVGAAVAHVRGGRVPFAYGDTFVDAALAVVPRFLWKEKSQSAGSGDLVSIYTGLQFQGDTSVGVGQVLECYINFGTPGVIIAFFVIGSLVVLVDRKGYRALFDGNAGRFTLWYMPGLSLLLVGSSFVDATMSAAAGLAIAFVLHVVIRHLPQSAPAEPDEPELDDAAVEGPGER